MNHGRNPLEFPQFLQNKRHFQFFPIFIQFSLKNHLFFSLGGLGQGHPPPRRRPRQPRPGRRLRRPGALAHGLGAAAGGAGEVGQRGGTRGSGAWDPTGTVVFPKNP